MKNLAFFSFTPDFHPTRERKMDERERMSLREKIYERERISLGEKIDERGDRMEEIG